MANDLIIYDAPEIDQDLEVDFLDTSDLETMEEGIRKIQVTSDILGLIQGIAMVRTEREELWRQGGYETLAAYKKDQPERYNMPKQTISNRKLEGESFIDNRKLLGKMSLTGHVTKLLYLSEALRVHGDKKEVLAHFKADSFREFKEWVRPRSLAAPDLPDVEIHVDHDEISLDGVPMLSFDEDLPAEERDFIAQGLRDLYRARRGALVAVVLGVYDAGEGRWLEKALKEHRAQK